MISYFSTLIVDFVQAHWYYADVAVFLLAMSEAIPVVGTVVPGSTLVIAILEVAARREFEWAEHADLDRRGLRPGRLP